MKIQSFFILLLFATLSFSACNKNSNELPVLNPADSSFLVPITLFGNRTDIVSAAFSRYQSTSSDSVFIRFHNRSAAALNNLRIAVEFSTGQPASYANSLVLLTQTLNIPPKDSSARLLVAANQRLSFLPERYNVYVLGYDSSGGPGMGGLYQNKYSLFRHDTVTKRYVQPCGFVQVDGSALFRIKISDNLEYKIQKSRFANAQTFTGELLSSDGEIVSYLSLDTAQSQYTPTDARFVLKLSKPLDDSTDNIVLNMFRN